MKEEWMSMKNCSSLQLSFYVGVPQIAIAISSMKQAITSDQMYRIEEKGHSILGMRRYLMMENAGHGLADFIASRFRGNLRGKKIVVVCGIGNNGGDGFVASRHLAGYGPRITVLLLGNPADLRSEEAKLNWSILERMDSLDILFGTEFSPDLRNSIAKANVIIDAIFGTGIRGQIREPYLSAIDAINSNRRAFVLAVDVPSGFDPNTGEIHDHCVKANATLTFHRLKVGLARGKKYTGPVHVEKIGIPPDAESGIV
jgi:NAD(P)H-hydrate epimerase